MVCGSAVGRANDRKLGTGAAITAGAHSGSGGPGGGRIGSHAAARDSGTTGCRCAPAGAAAGPAGSRAGGGSGHGTLVDFDTGTPVGSVRSRLDFNVVDFAYGNGLIAPSPHSDVQWSIGVRLAQAFFDARAEDVVREVRTSNHFLGAGPLGAIE